MYVVRIFKHDFSFKNTGATTYVSHHKQDHLNQYQNTDCIVLGFFPFIVLSFICHYGDISLQ